MLMVTFLTPLSEYFDRWDRPGIANDTEFALFTVILSLVFVLLVCRLVAVLCMALTLEILGWLLAESSPLFSSQQKNGTLTMPPLILAPLRI